MGNSWYFSDEYSPSDELVDRFADSKFGIDKWGSFAREIIQNSLDAVDDEKQPVKVVFDLNKELTLTDIPGGEKTKEVLELCEKVATNKQTKSAYLKGLEILGREKVHCLKISDYNTKGVETGRDQAWGALVFDEGKSKKMRPGSAGSHGVGKKVPFIISTCNTVFYATKNKYDVEGSEVSDCLMQGKTTLINWCDNNGIRKNSKGWFGVINEDETNPKHKVDPITVFDDVDINPYFVRKDEYGTDVIIVGANIYEDYEIIKCQIISAILDNFFVAILRNKLVISVFDEEINSTNFYYIANKFYKESSEVKNNLSGCMRVYSGEPSDIIPIISSEGEELGTLDIYFGLDNEYQRKYYTIVRSHGMRIRDNRVNSASMPYTAVVVIQGERLNELLSKLENAAHDDFITDDENLEIDERAKEAYRIIRTKMREYIEQATKIDAEKGQELEGLNNIINIPGMIVSVKKKNPIPQVRRNRVAKKGKGQKAKDYLGGSTGAGDGDDKNKKKKKGMKKPAVKGDDFESILYESYKVEPTFIKSDQGTVLKVEVNDNIRNAEIRLYSINSEGKLDDSICDYIDSVNISGTVRKCENGKITNVALQKGKTHSIGIKLSKNVNYQLEARVFVKECDIYE